MRAEGRLLKLLSMPDGGEATQSTRAMAAALASGIDYVKNLLTYIKSGTALTAFIHPDKEYLENLLNDIEYTANRGEVKITKYNSETVGEKVGKCFFSRCGISLGSNGLTWKQTEEKDASWKKINKLQYRWDMIESR